MTELLGFPALNQTRFEPRKHHESPSASLGIRPLVVFVTLIQLMDAYRVFEPILVFGSRVYANSVQYQTYYILNIEENSNKAAAAGLLTIVGVGLLILPSLRRIWHEQRGTA